MVGPAERLVLSDGALGILRWPRRIWREESDEVVTWRVERIGAFVVMVSAGLDFTQREMTPRMLPIR